jgi:hypothetical protein
VIRAAGRDRVDDLVIENLLVPNVLNVDHRAFAGDRDRFLQRPDAQIGVDCCRKRPFKLDALAADHRESRQRKDDAVGARAQVDDAVLPRRIRHGGAHLLDQGRARRFDGHAR